jgi:hypothetical protein
MDKQQTMTVADLCALVEGLDGQAAAALLDLVSIPVAAPCLGQVITNLTNVWSRVRFHLATASIPTNEAWRALHFLQRASTKLRRLVQHFDRFGDARHLPLRNLVDAHPVYAMLSREALDIDRFHEALAAVIASHARLAKLSACKDLAMDRFADRLRGGCRDVRRLPVSICELLPATQSLREDDVDLTNLLARDPLADYHAALTQLFGDPKHGLEWREHLKGLELLLRAAIEEAPPLRRDPGSRKGKGAAEQRWSVTGSPPDDDDLPRVRIWSSTEIDDDAREAEKAGCAPGETPGPVVYAMAELPEPEATDPDPSPSSFAVQALRQADYIAAAAQHLPRRWDRLQPSDVRKLFIELHKLASTPPAGRSPLIPPRELAAFVAVTFWLSAPADRVRQLRVVRGAAEFPKRADAGTFVYASGDHCWCLPVMTPDVKQAAAVQRTGQARPLAQRLILPDAGNVGRWLEPLLNDGQCRQVFEHQIAEYVTAAKQWLNSIDPKAPHRLTWQRLETTVFWAIANGSTDLPTAVLTLARKHADAATPLHYYAPTVASLRAEYLDACGELNSYIDSPVPPATTSLPLDAEGHAGSALCPLDEVTQLLVGGLTSTLSAARRNVKSPTYVIDLHNAFAVYVSLMLGTPTGYRAVCDPLSRVDHFDVTNGKCIIADKTGDRQHGVRVALLPPLLCEQLNLYMVHLHALLLRLELLNAETHRRLQSLLENTRIDDPLPVLFLLDLDGAVRSLRPRSLGPRLKAIGFHLPLNSNRHFLRTKLRECGATGEEIALLMGHWRWGQEPFNPFASFGFDDLEKRIAPLLQDLLVKAGWRARRGLS